MRSVEHGICPIATSTIRMYGACTKRTYFHFRSKVSHNYRVPQPQFPQRCENFGNSSTFKADIGLLNICMGFQDLLA